MGFVDRDGFLKEVERLRNLGFKRIRLKTGAYSQIDLAMALRYGAEAKLDLITIDGAGGGTGMSPWPLMNEWGIPTMVGKNIGKWLSEGTLPKTVSKHGTKKEDIFVCYEELKGKYGNEINQMPLGAIGVYTMCQKLKVGLQQLMAGSRNFRLSTISRRDLMALTAEDSKI